MKSLNKLMYFLLITFSVSGARDLQGDDECNQAGGDDAGADGTRKLQTTCPTPAISTGEKEVWEPLSSSERSYVSGLLEQQLILVSSDNPFLNDDVLGVTLEEPNKAETLAYLDSGGPLPCRFARATVYYGSLGYIMEYLVGPLPFPNFSTPADTDVNITAVRQPNEIPLPALPLAGSQYSALASIISGFLNVAEVDSLLNQAFGSSSTMSWTTHEFGTARNRTNVVPVSWYRRFSLVDNILSHPLPLEVMVEFDPYTDSSQWRVHSVVFQHQFFPEVSDFVNAIASGSVNIRVLPTFTENPFWQTLEKRASLRPNNCDPPATNVEPGARYTMVGGRVSWLGWNFHVTNRPRTATALHDVSFMGERIAYELSLQELQAIYTGYVPSMANKFLYDTNFYFGSTNRQLVAGVDCPKGATIFGNACVFEHDKGGPIWRKDGGRAWYAGAKGTHLVVRAIFEVGNYDYLVEFKFGLDGQIDIGFGATGQLFMSPYDAIEEPFGTRVQEEALANLHAHYGGFKVDLDILGINNCVEKESVVFKTRTEIPGADNQPAWNVPAKNLAVERQMVTNETDARVRVDNMAPVQWKVVSCTEKNQWGYLKGYEIVHPNTPLAIYDEAFPGYQAYHTVFAQRKESEPYISTQFDSMTRGEPYVPITGTGVDAISNGESLDNQDIVAWVGLGFYHIPRAEDNPVTNTVLGHFSIRPFNYYDENPSLDVGQTVRYRSSVVQNDIPEGGCTVSV